MEHEIITYVFVSIFIKYNSSIRLDNYYNFDRKVTIGQMLKYLVKTLLSLSLIIELISDGLSPINEIKLP